eukprot:TRINITY_DN868_c0_g1_i1.p4 TRINITY_DN868_c0_g1~~TRINITY_DN868_c0_g1_i1.p4  ORF type:complete len:104 (+),score=13.52 TRINITY_DN868_c0_g1_i1:680-991(+)
MQVDLPGNIKKIAQFLNIAIDDDEIFQRIVEHCSFEYMKNKALSPVEGSVWKGGSKSFFHKGVNQQWRGDLTKEDVQRYEEIIKERLGEACGRWYMTGQYEST